MAVWMPYFLTMLFAADPALAVKAPQPTKAKIYIVYVTVVEVDADGNETVLFTPRVQTTGNPAGVTVDRADGRSFEFNCQLAAAAGSVLERPPAVTTAPSTVEASQPVSAATLLPPTNLAAQPKPASAVSVVRKTETFSVRTYDVSDLLGPSDKLTAAEFEPLIQTLKSVAVPDSWTGPATIRPFSSTKSLVIKQHAAGHKAVAAALDELRPRKIEQDELGTKN